MDANFNNCDQPAGTVGCRIFDLTVYGLLAEEQLEGYRERLEQRTAELALANEKLQQQITEHRQAEESFRQQMNEMAAANEQLKRQIAEHKDSEEELLEGIIEAKAPTEKKLPFNPQELKALSELAKRLR